MMGGLAVILGVLVGVAWVMSGREPRLPQGLPYRAADYRSCIVENAALAWSPLFTLVPLRQERTVRVSETVFEHRFFGPYHLLLSRHRFECPPPPNP